MERTVALERPAALPTAIGSLPYTDPEKACQLVLTHLPEIPFWPQLTRRSFLENMYAQFSSGFPGLVQDGERLYVDLSRDFDADLGTLISDREQEAVASYALDPAHAAGFHAFLESKLDKALAVKGHLVGPVSLALTITDQERRPIIYHDILSDAIANYLHLQAAWQERELRVLCPNTIIFLDEPYMASFGSAFFAISREKVVELLEEVLSAIKGLKGVHCCGNTDWSILLSTSADILSLDAYSYIETLSLYPIEVQAFLKRGGIIAWGVVPTEEKTLSEETTESLVARLEEGMDLLIRKGIARDTLLQQSLITPSCGLGAVSPLSAERALGLVAKVSQKIRTKYRLQ